MFKWSHYLSNWVIELTSELYCSNTKFSHSVPIYFLFAQLHKASMSVISILWLGNLWEIKLMCSKVSPTWIVLSLWYFPVAYACDFPPHTMMLGNRSTAVYSFVFILHFTSLDCGSWSKKIVLCQKKEEERQLASRILDLMLEAWKIWKRVNIPAILLSGSFSTPDLWKKKSLLCVNA